MITSFEVGAVFKIINEASPQLTKILRQVRELQKAIDKVKASMAEMTKAIVPTGLGTAIDQTNALAASWREVATQSRAAQRALGGAGSAANRAALPPAGGGGNRGLFRPGARGGHGGGGYMHINGPGIALPGGGHFRAGGIGGGVGMAGLGLLGYGIAQAMSYDDAVVFMAQHAGVDLATNRDKFRKMLTDATTQTGFGEHDVASAAQQELRMFGDTGGSNGVNVLPKMLRYAATEARLKGTSLEESMSSLTGLAHMLQKYGEDDVDKIAPAFSALSTRNPMTLAQQERAFGYAVPLLQSSLGMDPFSVMAGSTALARAGISSTKAGTWLRELAVRAMPGTSLMSKMAFQKHEEALKAFGLVDDKGSPTWFTDGHGDFMKLLKIASENASKIPMEKRASYERQLFGAQGSGALSVLSEPAVAQQMGLLAGEMTNPETVNRARNFMSVYNEQSSLQNARTAFQTFNVLMADLGDKILPSVNGALRDFKSILETIRDLIPGGKGKEDKWKVGTRALEFGGLGALGGFALAGPPGALAGGVGGGLLGGAIGIGEGRMGIDKGGSYTSPGKTGKPAEPKDKAVVPPINLSINLDGRPLTQVVIDKLSELYRYDTNSPAFNGSNFFNGP